MRQLVLMAVRLCCARASRVNDCVCHEQFVLSDTLHLQANLLIYDPSSRCCIMPPTYTQTYITAKAMHICPCEPKWAVRESASVGADVSCWVLAIKKKKRNLQASHIDHKFLLLFMLNRDMLLSSKERFPEFLILIHFTWQRVSGVPSLLLPGGRCWNAFKRLCRKETSLKHFGLWILQPLWTNTD